MNRRAFLPLVASFVAFHPFGATLFAADAPRLSGPIVHDNLAIYLVHGAATAGAVPLTLQEFFGQGDGQGPRDRQRQRAYGRERRQ